MERIERQLGLSGRTHPDIMRHIPDILRKNEFKVTTVLFGEDIIAVEGGNTSGKKYGIGCGHRHNHHGGISHGSE